MMRQFSTLLPPAWMTLALCTVCVPRAAVCAAEGNTAEGPPNFIVFFCDNLGYGDIEPFGSTVHRTPHLNRMAREGRKFTHFCVTAGVCTPSRASIMTGCYAQRVNMHHNPRDGHVLRPVSPHGLHPQEITIAEVLKHSATRRRSSANGTWGISRSCCRRGKASTRSLASPTATT